MGWPEGKYARVAQQRVALPPVAAPAGDLLVLPAVGGPPTGCGNDVVDRELGGGHPLAAVLAGAVVPKEEGATGRPQEAARGLDVGQEADDDNVRTKATPGH